MTKVSKTNLKLFSRIIAKIGNINVQYFCSLVIFIFSFLKNKYNMSQ